MFMKRIDSNVYSLPFLKFSYHLIVTHFNTLLWVVLAKILECTEDFQQCFPSWSDRGSVLVWSLSNSEIDGYHPNGTYPVIVTPNKGAFLQSFYLYSPKLEIIRH